VTINTGDEGSKGPSIEDQYNTLVEEGLIAPEGDTPGEEAGDIEKVAKEGSNEERPDWLPPKFKSVEDFVKSYGELEKKLGSGKRDAVEEEAPPAETTTQATPEERKAAEEAAKKAGLDLKAVSAEYLENDGLAEETYSKLEAAGYPREMVDIYIEGLTNRTNATVNAAYEAVGGADSYSAMIDWAISNLDDGEQAAFDAAVNSNNKSAALMAVRGLKARMDASARESASQEPEEQISKGGKTGGSVYLHEDEYMDDLNDPRYDKNEAFRRQVMAKLSRSNIMM
jgi:hypothetical protein